MIAYYKLLDYLNRYGWGKESFRKTIGISSATMAKISKNEPVSLSVIDKICKELECQPGDILEYYEEVYRKPNERKLIKTEREPLDSESRDIISTTEIIQHGNLNEF